MVNLFCLAVQAGFYMVECLPVTQKAQARSLTVASVIRIFSPVTTVTFNIRTFQLLNA